MFLWKTHGTKNLHEPEQEIWTLLLAAHDLKYAMPPPSLASVFKDVKKSTPDQSGKASGAPASGSRLALFTKVAALQGRRPQSALPQPKATTSSFFAQMAAKQKENSQPEPEEQKVGVDFTITLVKEEAARAEFLGQTGSRGLQ